MAPCQLCLQFRQLSCIVQRCGGIPAPTFWYQALRVAPLDLLIPGHTNRATNLDLRSKSMMLKHGILKTNMCVPFLVTWIDSCLSNPRLWPSQLSHWTWLSFTRVKFAVQCEGRANPCSIGTNNTTFALTFANIVISIVFGELKLILFCCWFSLKAGTDHRYRKNPHLQEWGSEFTHPPQPSKIADAFYILDHFGKSRKIS